MKNKTMINTEPQAEINTVLAAGAPNPKLSTDSKALDCVSEKRGLAIGATLYHNHFQNFKVYQIPKAQLIIADIPYNLGNNAYASNPSWYKDGDNKNGESELAGKEFFDTDKDFRPAEFMHFCSTMLKKEDLRERTEADGNKRLKSNAPCMIVFCEFEQQFMLIELGKKYGLNRYINLVFRKNFSAQVLKANMKVVGNCEYAVLFYRDRLPKFNNKGKMIFNCFDWPRENEHEKLHPTQKPVALLKQLIEIFTDEGDVVIDPVAGSGSSLVAALEMNRNSYGFEIKKNFHMDATKWINEVKQRKEDIKKYGFNKSDLEKIQPTLF
jgi:site-specific DNA-methyltransferase (adenine-specific)